MSSHSAITAPRYTTRMLMLLVIAFAVSGWLLYHHVSINYGGQTDPSICNINETFNCDEVAKSPYSEFFGIPVASLGAWYYLGLTLLILLFAPAVNESAERKAAFADILLFLTSLGLLIAVVMFSLSMVSVGALCLFCMGLYLINILLFLVVFLTGERSSPFGAGLLRGAADVFKLLVGSGLAGEYGFLRLAVLWLMMASGGAILLKSPGLLISRVFEPRLAALESTDNVLPIIRQWRSAPQRELLVSDSGTLLEQDFILGPDSADFTLVEFADFQCPACRRASFMLKPLLDRFPGRVRLVFKNFPLSSECNRAMDGAHHLYACRAALMARCAGLQGEESFWQMHDELFNLTSWDEEVLEALPSELGLDQEAFGQCVQSEAALERVVEDVEVGIQNQLTGTPSVFLNGRPIAYANLQMLPGILKHLIEEKQP